MRRQTADGCVPSSRSLQATDVPDVGLESTDSVRATDEQLLPSEAARVLLFELTSRDVSNMEFLLL